MYEEIGVNNARMNGMHLNVTVLVLIDNILQMSCEQHLGQFALIVCIRWIIVFSGRKTADYDLIMVTIR